VACINIEIIEKPIIEEVSVVGVCKRLYQTEMVRDTIQKTEVISGLSIESAQAASLVEAIVAAPGVRVNNECSNVRC